MISTWNREFFLKSLPNLIWLTWSLVFFTNICGWELYEPHLLLCKQVPDTDDLCLESGVFFEICTKSYLVHVESSILYQYLHWERWLISSSCTKSGHGASTHRTRPGPLARLGRTCEGVEGEGHALSFTHVRVRVPVRACVPACAHVRTLCLIKGCTGVQNFTLTPASLTPSRGEGNFNFAPAWRGISIRGRGRGRRLRGLREQEDERRRIAN